MDLIIKNGTVVTAAGLFKADIGISDGVIVAIAGDLAASSEQVVDASGRYVMPGGVDVHTHLDCPGFQTNSADDFRTGTIAAACGGTTTIVDFCQQKKGQTLAEALATWHRKADGKAVIDYGFHIIVTDMNEGVFAELDRLPEQGVTSFKLFMAYKDAMGVDDGVILKALDRAKAAGALVMVHAEHGEAASYLQQKYLAAGKTAPKYHAASRPPRIEAEATARAIALAEIVGTSIYIVHLTCREAFDEVMRGRARGVEVLAETCTQYLHLTAGDLDRDGFEGAKYVFTPPPRTEADQKALWTGLENRALHAVSSDHASWSYRGSKDLGLDDFTKIPNGGPGIEERMTMVFQGVNDGRLGLDRFVDLTATMPARIFGLYPKKGTIAVGSDADLVLWNPMKEAVISQSNLHHAVDYTLYEGRRVRGRPETVLLRGKVIVQDGQFVGEEGSGQFIRRRKFAGAGAVDASALPGPRHAGT